MNILKRFKKNGERPSLSESSHQSLLKQYGLEAALIIVTAVIIALLFPRGKSFEFADLKEGQVYIGEEIIAPFTFPVLKSQEEYQRDVAEAQRSVMPVFEYRETVQKEQIDRLRVFLDRLELLLKARPTALSNLKELFNEFGVTYSDDDLTLLLNGFFRPEDEGRSDIARRVAALQRLANIILPLIRERYTVGILDRPKDELMPKTADLSVRRGDREVKEPLEYYQDQTEAKSALLAALRNADLSDREIKIAYNIASFFLTANTIYDQMETEARVADRVNTVPLAKDQVLAGERIIDGHQRLTKQHIEKLHSLAVAKAERGEAEGFWSNLAPTLGKFFMVLLILALPVFYVFREQGAIIKDRKKMLLIGLNLLFIAVCTHLVTRLSISPYLIPVTTVSILITIFFDTKIGLLVTLTSALLVGAMRGNEFSAFCIALVAGSVAVQTVRKVRTRNWVINSGALISAAYAVTSIVLGLVAYDSIAETLRNTGVGVLNGFLAPGLAYLLIIILEAAFDMTTDMTLLELSDFNHPLLRRLLLDAPGTYHHSYLTGLLAESAVEALNGNTLLARVGAYFHDIGKLEKPEYFIENQTRGRNPQEKLTPTMSALILANHVRRGIEIAREYGLPKEVEAFIQQHHGSSLMSYFYQKAQELNNGESISENEFRYPGPRPQTRETAVVMLADAVEAASRTLKDPAPNRVKNLVEQIIDERFKVGELDESPLTLRDLSKIAAAFNKVLMGRFHGRIDYPTFNDNKNDEKKNTQPD